ncbi:hypothetical protein [Gordonia sp. CPCC 205333]|uniref:hypothetical protein n=1 Tax=Gordonia sp. CPCC 205333 TaxID=3140790 RepID=UPI003AF344B7
MLDQHIPSHTDNDDNPLTVHSYRHRHTLDADVALRGPDTWREAWWHNRLHAAGFSSWDETIIYAAREHLGPYELAGLLGSTGQVVWAAMTRNRTDEHLCAVTAPHRISRHGHLGDDGARLQCHECGLWFRNLAAHLKLHHDEDGTTLTAATYRQRHHLSATHKLAHKTTAGP